MLRVMQSIVLGSLFSPSLPVLAAFLSSSPALFPRDAAAEDLTLESFPAPVSAMNLQTKGQIWRPEKE